MKPDEERDVRGGHDCRDHQYADSGHCGVCHERQPMIEVAMVFDREGRALFWPAPQGSAGSIPDSTLLWDRVWACRDIIGGIAHTHPWMGEVWPSATDLTTFRAIEKGLGKKLVWPIITFSEVKYYVWDDPDESYATDLPTFVSSEVWLQNIEELRRLSRNEGV